MRRLLQPLVLAFACGPPASQPTVGVLAVADAGDDHQVLCGVDGVDHSEISAADAVMDWLYALPAAPLVKLDGKSVIVGQLTLLIVRIPLALTADCASGFVTVTVRAPAAAPAETLIFNVTCVGSVNVTPLTVTPLPPTDAAILFGNSAPGS